jgi:hypothetical protein
MRREIARITFFATALAMASRARSETPPGPVGTPPAHRVVTTGEAFEGNWVNPTGSPPPLFHVRLEWEGESQLTATNTDRSGQVVLQQVLQFAGSLPVSYSMTSPGAEQEGRLTVTADELVMESVDHGEKKTARKKKPKLFTVGPGITAFIEHHLPELKGGQQVEFEMVVVNRLDTYALKLVVVPGDETGVPEVADGRWLKVAIRPTNLVAGLFAPKMEAFVDSATGRMVAFRGPMPNADGTLLKVVTVRYDSK